MNFCNILLLLLVGVASLCSITANAALSSDAYYDFFYSLYSMRQLQGPSIKALWASSNAMASAQTLAGLLASMHYDQSKLPAVLSLSTTSSALLGYGSSSDVSGVMQMWSSDSASANALTQPGYSTAGIGNSGQYWAVVLGTS
ncbi:hypothetical protein GGI02_001153 [Coemansia sp. RSA 2322]|nr:hypothetical protein GGI02_001153 [Coemansia sp. RSA 2322]